MTTDLRNRSHDTVAVNDVPSWVLRLLGDPAAAAAYADDGQEVGVVTKGDWSLCSIRVPDAKVMHAEAFRSATTSAYRMLRRVYREYPDQRPVRMWNFIPGILDPVDGHRHRYMAFNAGRFDAFSEWHGEDESLSRWVPTSSGVGNSCSDLVIHALACSLPRVPVENPRQVSAYRYSLRYGPRPPCFSRAVRVERNGLDSTVLLLGGTASVVGEDTVHPEDLPAQMNETLQNLAALVQEGLFRQTDHPSTADGLQLVRQLRVYYVRDDDLAAIDRVVTSRFARACQLEYARTTLCRDGLLVEMEGVATLSPWPELWRSPR